MLWIIERILDRLFLRSALEMSSRKEAEMEIVHAQSRAELLRQAKQFEDEQVPGFEELARTLRKKAAEMESGVAAPGASAMRIADELRIEGEKQSSVKGRGSLLGTNKGKAVGLPAPTKKKRGRPRKHRAEELAAEPGESVTETENN